MKRLVLLLCVVGCTSKPTSGNVVMAPSVPYDAKLAWDPNVKNTVGYLVTPDNGDPVTVLASSCTPTECSVKLPVTTFGRHTYTVAAYNKSGDGGTTQMISPPSTLTFELKQGVKK
jgi:hypothetical protein